MKKAGSIRKYLFLLIVSFVIPSTLAVYAAEKSIKVKPVGPTEEAFALLIGICDYQDPNIPDLEFTKNDVILLGSTLIGHLGFSPDRVIPLFDRAANKQAIGK